MIKIIIEKYHSVYKPRVAEFIADLCPDNSSILDIGCDDGTIADLMMKINPTLKIFGVDIQEKRPPKIPRTIYDGVKIPYGDNSFDIVIMIDCLHHCNNILTVLQEAKRLTKNAIIIKDHTFHNKIEIYLLKITDRLTNSAYGIKCVDNFLPIESWYNFFKFMNLKLIDEPKNLKFGFWMTEYFNPIFKLVK